MDQPLWLHFPQLRAPHLNLSSSALILHHREPAHSQFDPTLCKCPSSTELVMCCRRNISHADWASGKLVVSVIKFGLVHPKICLGGKHPVSSLLHLNFYHLLKHPAPPFYLLSISKWCHLFLLGKNRGPWGRCYQRSGPPPNYLQVYLYS